MVSLIVKIPLKPERKEEYIEAFKEMAAAVGEKEPDCLCYSLCFPKDQPNTAVLIERYKDQDAFSFHTSTDYFKTFVSKPGFSDGQTEVLNMDEVVTAK